MHIVFALLAAMTILVVPGGLVPMAFASPSQQLAEAPRAYSLGFLDYRFTLNSSQIFPNETIKQDVLNNHTRSQYNISSLEHELMGYRINASDVKVNVTPSSIDEARTRLDLQIYAERVNVTGSADRFYDRVELESLYGIHDRRTDLIEMHVPLDVALSYLGLFS